MNKTNIGLVKHAEKWLGQAYWFGTYCQSCTEARLNGKKKQYPGHYTAGRMAIYRQHIRQGKKCTDCVGLIKGYCWDGTEGNPKYASNGCPDTSANGMYRAARVKGGIKTLPETPGLLLWRDGHIGVYVGNGYAIEARGFAYGVVKTKVKDRTWTNWCECPYIKYEGKAEETLGGRILKMGMEGADVKALQEKLMELGYELPKFGADGEYGDETIRAVKAFQRANGLVADGEYGPDTHGALTGAQGGDAPDAQVEIIGDCHLRIGPGTQFESVGIARKGDRLDRADETGWAPVILRGEAVWVSEKYAKERGRERDGGDGKVFERG